MIILLFLSILLVLIYVGETILKNKKLPESMSAMVYDLSEFDGWRWIWTLWIWLLDLFAFIPMIELLDVSGLSFIGFIPLVLLAFVGAWPLFDEEHRKYHYILAIIAGIMSQVCVFIIYKWSLVLWVIFPIICLYKYIKHKKGIKTIFDNTNTFIAEGISALTVYVSEFLKLT